MDVMDGNHETGRGGGFLRILPLYLILLVILFIGGWFVGYRVIGQDVRRIVMDESANGSAAATGNSAGSSGATRTHSKRTIPPSGFSGRVSDLHVFLPGADADRQLPVMVYESGKTAADVPKPAYYSLAIDLLDTASPNPDMLYRRIGDYKAPEKPFYLVATTSEGKRQSMVILADYLSLKTALDEHAKFTKHTKSSAAVIFTPLSSAPLRNLAKFCHYPPPRRPYSLRLESSRSRKDVIRAAARHEKNGVASFYTRIELGESDIWWSLYHGHLEDISEAKQEKSEINAGLIRKLPYTTLNGLFTPETDLTQIIETIKGITDFPPVAVHLENGLVALYTGAYVTESAAIEMAAKLTEHQISAWVIER